MRQLGQQLVGSSLLLQGQDFPRFSQLMMHPVVSAANAALQQPRLNTLSPSEDKDKEALGLLAWYGAREVTSFQTAASPSYTVCEAAAALSLPMPGQREFVNAVREPVCSSNHLAALWQCCPGQASLLLRSLAHADTKSVREVGYHLLRPDSKVGQQDNLPARQAVCLMLTCITCQCMYGIQ